MNLTGFQPCDVRGEYGEGPEAQISPAHARLIGRALASLVPNGGRLLLAGDGRASTPPLIAALSGGYARVRLNLGAAIPTPLAYFAKHLFRIHSSAIVTASHNPPRFNGIKLQLGDWPAQTEMIRRIRDDLALLKAVQPGEDDAQASPIDSAEREAAWAAYKQHVKATFPLAKGMRVAVDCMHGCYSGRAGELLEEQGYAVTPLRDTLAGDFNGITPDPSEDRNLAALRGVAAGGSFAFGAALDGDGDRVRFVDERGQPIDNGAMLVLLVRYLLESGRTGGRVKVVYDQKIRLAVVRALRAAGAPPVMEKSGHTFIRTRMLREGALFGGEVSGHFFWGAREFYPVEAGDCGLFTMMAVGDMLDRAGQPLSVLAHSVPESPYYTGDIRGLRYEGNRVKLLESLAASVDRARYQVSREDGVRIETPDAFAHLRASVTESQMLTAAFDAVDRPALVAMAELVVRQLPGDARTLADGIMHRINQAG